MEDERTIKLRQFMIKDIRNLFNSDKAVQQALLGEDFEEHLWNLRCIYDHLCYKERERKIREIEDNLSF